MRICPGCGRNFPDDYAFCLDDGAALSAPIEGEKTELIKGPYRRSDGEATERMPLDAAEPAPTEASPLPTIETSRPKRYSDAGDQPSRSNTGLWVAIAVLLTGFAASSIYFLGLKATDGNANRPITVEPAISPTSKPSTSAETPAEPAAIAGNPIVGKGRTEAETVPEPLTLCQVRGYISKWNVKAGDLLDNPCTNSVAARYTCIVRTVARVNGPLEDVEFDEYLMIDDPSLLVSIDVKPREIFFSNQRVATLGRIKHIWISAKVRPEEAVRIATGTKAYFTESTFKTVHNGTVESVNTSTGDVRITIPDEEVFETQGREGTNCLRVKPNWTGEVTFAVSNVPK